MTPDSQQAWPLRAAICSALGVGIGFAADALLDGAAGVEWRGTRSIGRIALAGALVVAGILFAATVERLRWWWSAVFALAGALVVAGMFVWNGSPSAWQAGEQWHFASAFFALALAAPLFQSARDAGRWRVEEAAFHRHAWDNVFLWFGAWAFALLAFLIAHLLSALFKLVGIDLLESALEQSGFVAALIGGAFGGAVALLRERARLLGTVRRAVLAVLAVLAPVLALGLALFILALPFTGLAPLWAQTEATTPILLLSLTGAIALANAVTGVDEDERRSILSAAAMVLAAVMLPLALVAAISTGLRIEQHGLTPERLWGVTFVAAFTAVALSYMVALLRRRAFAARVRIANVRLAGGLAVAGLLLATPLASFGALSARDQLSRLRAGVVTPEQFDWMAMRFDFGPAGRAALERLAASEAVSIRRYARNALARPDRFDDGAANGEPALTILPRPVEIPEPLARLATSFCGGAGDCLLHWRPGEANAVAILDGCRSLRGREIPGDQCAVSVAVFEQAEGAWRDVRNRPPRVRDAAPAQGAVEIRTVPRRQVFIGEQAMGEAFE